jgi:predicted RNA polymerase sigma factor
MHLFSRTFLTCIVFISFVSLALAKGVRVEFNPQRSEIGPYPTDFQTVPDERQVTGLRVNRPGIYQIQAAISAVHADADDATATDWAQIVQLYDQLFALQPTSIVALNRAIAIGEASGPAAALAIVEGLDLEQYHLYHATRGELLERLERTGEAVAAYEQALALATNAAERRHLEGRIASIG